MVLTMVKLCRLKFSCLILFFVSNAAFACKSIDYDYVLKMPANELAKEGCTKEYIRLLKSSDGEIIRVVSKLIKSGRAERNSLNLLAFSYFRLGLYTEALHARLSANKSYKRCLLLKSCTWDPYILLRYENAIFYRAAGFKDEYEVEMLIGDIHFNETCPTLWNRPNAYEECTKTRNRYINSIYEQFGYAITWDINEAGYLSIFKD